MRARGQPRSNDYVQRINRATDFLSRRLDDPSSLGELAAEACFSPYHFHRIFRAVVGETVHGYTQRVRVSRAALRLRAAPRASATRVALDCGFSSLSAFSRAFKQVFGVRLRDWNRDDPLQNRKICQAALALRRYTPAELEGVDAQREFRVSVRPFPPTRIAYIRIANAYSNGNVLSGYFRLRRWADAVIGPGPYRTIGMSGDDPDITPLELCRYDIAIAVPGHVTGDGEVCVRTLPGGPMAVVRAAGDLALVDRAWQYLFRHWLPRSRYQPADTPAMEMFLKTPEEIGWERFDLECCVPLAEL